MVGNKLPCGEAGEAVLIAMRVKQTFAVSKDIF